MKLYVGNLPWSINEDGLKNLFSAYAVTEASLIIDKFSKRSKGFGFVTIADDEEAKKAISEMHEKDIEGRKITVSEAKPMVPRENNGGSRGSFGGGRGGFRGGGRGGFGGGNRGGGRGNGFAGRGRRSFDDSEDNFD